ncbi:ABC transporter substrate-binding protein [Ruania alba]|uniref:Carbohydrate ABC transporter substrate-binding protein, CUT1 family n=1 Tax=Ruania alba TaxID=648782 RepID=A0A1H5M5H2_9MICO|nr:extracellular solute-binding protein [Ruania alba]SEE84616.1 carbohydrate ABC transporter substrate-binding protein, CUT1 family [Ruania alba]
MPLNRSNRTRAALASTSAAAMLALAACSGGGSQTPDDGPLTMYTWVSGESDQAQWDSFIAGAQEVDPDLEITVEGPSFTDYWTKVKTRLSGDNPPCILTTQAARAQELEALLMPLDDLIAEQDLDTDAIDASMLQGMTVDGSVRAIPYDAEPIVLYYNQDTFTEAGLDLPTTTYTREQFLDDARALTDGEDYALAITPGIFIPNAWALADGVPAVTEDGELALTDPEFVAQMQSYYDLVAVEQVARAPEASDSGELAQQAFINGEVDMLIEGPWMYGTFAESAEFEMGLTIVPSTSGEATAMTAGSGFGIASNCDRPEEAFEAIVALTSQGVQETQAAERGIVPARIDALPAWQEGKAEGAGDVIAALLGNATAQLTTPTWNQVETLTTQYATQGYRGEMTAAEIMELISNSAASAAG